MSRPKARLEDVRAGDWVAVDPDTHEEPGEVVFCAPSGSYAPDFPVTDWPPDRYDGLMTRQADGGLIFQDRAGFEAGEWNVALITEPHP